MAKMKPYQVEFMKTMFVVIMLGFMVGCILYVLQQ